jgi:penicillin-binding protein 2
LLVGRLFFLQVIKGDSYRKLSDSNRTRTIPIHAPRGIIFDRQGVPLVFNTPGFREEVGGKTELVGRDDALKLLSEGKTNLEIDSLRNYPYKDAIAHVLGYIGQISEDELKQKEFADYSGGDLIGKIGIEGEYENQLRGINGKELVEIDSMGKVIRKLGQTDSVPGQNVTITLDIGLQKAAYEAAKDVKKRRRNCFYSKRRNFGSCFQAFV